MFAKTGIVTYVMRFNTLKPHIGIFSPQFCRACYFYGKITSHYGEVIIGTMASQITSLTIVYSTVYLGADQRKHQSSASLAFVRGIQRRPVNSPHKWPVTRKMFPFDDVIMHWCFTSDGYTKLLYNPDAGRHVCIYRRQCFVHFKRSSIIFSSFNVPLSQ